MFISHEQYNLLCILYSMYMFTYTRYQSYIDIKLYNKWMYVGCATYTDPIVCLRRAQRLRRFRTRGCLLHVCAQAERITHTRLYITCVCAGGTYCTHPTVYRMCVCRCHILHTPDYISHVFAQAAHIAHTQLCITGRAHHTPCSWRMIGLPCIQAVTFGPAAACKKPSILVRGAGREAHRMAPWL